MGKSISLQPRDWAVLEAIDRHGPLPSNFLYLITKHLSPGIDHHFVLRLTKLFNGSESTPPLLIRYREQQMHERALSMPLFHGLSPYAEQLLSERRHKHTRQRSDHRLHQFMQACVMASFEEGCKKRGIRFIHREEILARASSEALASRDPMQLGSATPDDLMGFQYPNGQYRFFAVEIDRATEQIRESSGKNTLIGKFKAYEKVFAEKLYKQRLDIPNLTVLFVTTGPGRITSSLFALKREKLEFAHKFAFKAEIAFGGYWMVPVALLDHLFEPWDRVGERLDISSAHTHK